jgi:hypothetical protein
MKLKPILESILSEQSYDVYHGSTSEFKKFDFNQSYQKIAWFTDSIESIESGEAGAKSAKYIMQFKIKIDNPAGWPEYKKYGIGQMKEQGYDGIILKSGEATNFIVFKPSQIKYVKTIKGG